MRNRLYLSAVIAIACLTGNASAQGVVSAPPSEPAAAIDTSVTQRTQPSVIDRPSDAVRRSAFGATAPLPATGQNLGEAKAMMAVGGAAIVVGALIGDDPGTILMFGGALVGLYGLWNYLK